MTEFILTKKVVMNGISRKLIGIRFRQTRLPFPYNKTQHLLISLSKLIAQVLLSTLAMMVTAVKAHFLLAHSLLMKFHLIGTSMTLFQMRQKVKDYGH